MKIPFIVGDKEFNITPYNSSQERDILLASSFGVENLDNILDILEFESEYELTEREKKVLLYKYREVSVGDEIDVKFKCDNCGQGNDSVLNANNFASTPERNDSDIKKIEGLPVNDDTLQEFVSTDVDELDIDEFEKLKERVIKNQIEFDFIKTTRCLKCGHEKKFDLSSPKYIIEIMSDDNLMSLYKSYNFLIYFGHHSKEGIDKMYPFERSIFIGLLNKTKEDLNK